MDKALDLSTHSLNKSTSKNKYSFPKANRFFPQINKPLCDMIYELPNLKSKRATSFGVGERNPEKIEKDLLSPKYYDKPSEFDKLVKKRGFSFGLGRDEIVGGMLNDKHSKEVPGPGLYNIHPLGQSSSVTLKSRNIDQSLKEQLLVPGPGAYDPTDNFNQKGKYYLSKHSNTRSGRFNPLPKSLSARDNSISVSPGPGKYDFIPGTTKNGKQFISKFGNSIASTFSRSNRADISLKHIVDNPGPGSYQIFSEFEGSPR